MKSLVFIYLGVSLSMFLCLMCVLTISMMQDVIVKNATHRFLFKKSKLYNPAIIIFIYTGIFIMCMKLLYDLSYLYDFIING